MSDFLDRGRGAERLRKPVLLAGLGALLLAACGGPIVPRSPEALYVLAREQMANSNYYPASDSLARVAREAPFTDWGRRARVLQIALLGGMARGYKQFAESYLAGSRQAGAAAYASQMRSMAMDYFGRARGRSLEMVEALDHLLREPSTQPLRVDIPLPAAAEAGGGALARVRQGTRLEDDERLRVEQQELTQGFAGMLATLGGAGDDLAQARARFQGSVVELDPAAFYLGAARELLAMSSIYGPEALGDRRLFRLYHARALAAAERAAQLAAAQGNARLREEAERLQQLSRAGLPKP